MLAAFAGWVIIGHVPAILHTPLMSGSNFVHGIVVVGGIFALLNASTVLEQAIGFFAVLLGAGNAAGGFASPAHAGDVPDQRAKTQARPNTRAHAPSPSTEEGLRNDHAHHDPQLVIGVTDLAAAFLFMYGLKRMSSPVTAPSGIFVAGIGMLAPSSPAFSTSSRRAAPSRICRSMSASASSPSVSAAASPGGPARKSR
jgi:hypothetical protein